MQYMGGKHRAGRHIAVFLDASLRRLGGDYYEPFVGGCNLLKHLELGEGQRAFMSDANEALIRMYQAYRKGWRPPTEVSKEEHRAARELPNSDPRKAFIRFGCSFGGVWSSGYARASADDPKRNYAQNAYKSLSTKRIGAALYRYGSYTCIGQPTGATIYCDPPYADTRGYAAIGEFDSAAFWQWARGMAATNDVFVSEYACPVEHRLVWSKEQKTTCTLGDRKTATECLFEVLLESGPRSASYRNGLINWIGER